MISLEKLSTLETVVGLRRTDSQKFLTLGNLRGFGLTSAVEIVDCEVCEAGSPLALENG